MKFLKSFELRKIGRENVLVQTENKEFNMGRIISLNESALLVYRNLKDKDFTLDDVKNILISNYEVDVDIAERDSKELVEALEKAGVLVY